eukprot:TRINITY_DN14570_c0_g2_i4.p1 TRINITY_DN14570_c0_g2~~TRINITY_DN14570_c0_g2_i4.p1  ORF type:complete len:186 (+),score=22.09 TRINITY_DN14570_c0_g2_i4:1241-1798(+)
MAKTVSKITSFQEVFYPLKRVPELQRYLGQCPRISDHDKLYQFSLFWEPRASAVTPVVMPEELQNSLKLKADIAKYRGPVRKTRQHSSGEKKFRFLKKSKIVVSSLEGIQWCWLNDDGGFNNYDEETSLLLETNYQKCPEKLMSLNHGFFGQSPGGYTIDFNNMTQTKEASGYVRHIRRKVDQSK